MSEHDRSAIAEFVTLIHGAPDDPDTTPGYVFFGRGHEPYRTDTGAVQYRRWEERPFSWPRQADDALDYATNTDADVFFTPAKSENPLRGSAKRKPLPVSWLWADIDHMTDRARARLADLVARGAVTVDSGSGPDRVHVYLPLEEPAPPAQAEHLNRRLAAALDADPAVGAHGGYLRLAGTLNRKPAVP